MGEPDAQGTKAQRISLTGLSNEDGHVEIQLSENALEARADFFPPTGAGKALDPDYLSVALERVNIVHGLDWDTVQTQAMECNLAHKIIRSVLIAKGDSPVSEIEEYFEMNPAFRVWPKMPDGEVPRVDYREISPFVIVKKGQKLAIRRAKVFGQDGKNIHGEIIEKTITRPDSARGGANTISDKDAIYAACDGRLIENKGELIVEEILAIKGGIDYKTGHVIFPGDVIIDGPVADGFKIYSGASIVAKQTLDASDVVSKKDLIVAGGIVGRLGGYIRVGNEVRAKFIQNCRIAARGAVFVGGAIINSQVFTMDRVDLGDKGKILGGEIYAIHGIKALAIGSERSRQTKIHCGIDFTVQQELERTNERIRVVSLKLQRLREKMGKQTGGAPVPSGPAAAEYQGIEERLVKDLEASNAKVSHLLGKLDTDENASIEVSGDVAADTLIEICHVALWIEKPLSKVRFTLDKAKGAIVIGKL